MILYLRDKKFNVICLIDAYQSLIWNDKYNEYGDFELYFQTELYDQNMFSLGYFLQCDISDHFMVIEKIKIEDDQENGSFTTLSGRSFESILEYRVYKKISYLHGRPEDVFNRIINDTMGNGTDLYTRVIPMLSLWPSELWDPSTSEILVSYVTSPEETAYDIIHNIAIQYDIGFKFAFTEIDEVFRTLKPVFQVYKGKNRSYEQKENDIVLCSESNGMILSGSYEKTNENYKNAAFIKASDEIPQSSQYSLWIGDEISGYDRKEAYIDGSSVPWDDPMMPLPEGYKLKLETYGVAQMGEYVEETNGDYEIDAQNGQFIFNKDFFLGDDIQVVFHGIMQAIRVHEVIFSEDDSGLTITCGTKSREQILWKVVKVQ